jgi:hypothetical protein
VEIEISPVPTPAERAAVATALQQLDALEADGQGSWWRAGLRDAVEGWDDDDTRLA